MDKCSNTKTHIGSSLFADEKEITIRSAVILEHIENFTKSRCWEAFNSLLNYKSPRTDGLSEEFLSLFFSQKFVENYVCLIQKNMQLLASSKRREG